jgi:hypothetical protein
MHQTNAYRLRSLANPISIGLILFFALNPLAAQKLPDAPTLKPNEHPNILFVAVSRGNGNDENGKPALDTLDPVAFLVGDEIYDCATPNPPPGEDNIPKTTIETLNHAYAKGRSYPLWYGGSPWGSAETVQSCIADGYMDLAGCVRLHPDASHTVFPKDFKGTVWTGKPPVATRAELRAKANTAERTIFLQAASAALAAHHVPAAPITLHTGIIWKTSLRSGHTALAGDTIVQLAAAKPRTYYSYRLFLVIEEDKGSYAPVLNQFHRATIELDSGQMPPKTGEILDEENGADKETFIDNFPLFAGEADAIISEHEYYEDWNYSIYRKRGASYQLVYIGCGGGD